MTEYLGLTDICACGHDLESHDLGDPHHRAGACAGHELDGPCDCTHYREKCRCPECDDLEEIEVEEMTTRTLLTTLGALVGFGALLGMTFGRLVRR